MVPSVGIPVAPPASREETPPVPDVEVDRFRREVRRSCSRYLAQKITEPVYLAEVRQSAAACGLDLGPRRTRDDRLLDALVWGTGSFAAGELPARLDPLLGSHAAGRLTDAALGREVATLLAQVQRRPVAEPRRRS
jgi:hypothetical protein